MWVRSEKSVRKGGDLERCFNGGVGFGKVVELRRGEGERMELE